MGCWNGTCMISNLPILFGDRIKVIMLRPSYSMKRMEQGASYVYGGDMLTPSFLQISGRYNDYGMIENIDEDWNTIIIEGVLKKILGKTINVDGEKLEEYNLENILRGIERNDLRYTGVEPEDIERQKLAKQACEVYEKSGWSSDKVKKEWEELRDMDVSKKTRLLKASWVMIREDVWNYIVETYHGEFWNPELEGKEKTPDIPYYIKAKEWCRWKFNNELEEIKNEKMISFREKIFSSQYAGDARLLNPFLYNELLKKADDELREKIFTKWSEFVIINSFLSSTRRGWMIQAGAGSQHEGWEDHKLLAQKVLEICDYEIKKWDEENEE